MHLSFSGLQYLRAQKVKYSMKSKTVWLYWKERNAHTKKEERGIAKKIISVLRFWGNYVYDLDSTNAT